VWKGDFSDDGHDGNGDASGHGDDGRCGGWW